MSEKSQASCVLIVDDDYYFSTEVLGYHLEKRGFRVLHAYTACEFEDKWRNADVILLDIRIPEKEGAPIDPWGGLNALNKILGKIKAENKQYPQLENCIIRSAHSKDDTTGAAIEVPHYFKWFSPDIPFSTIIQTVNEVAEKNKNQ